MKYAVVLLSGLLLTGCASIDLESERSTSAPAVSVTSPFVANPNVSALSTQLQNDYHDTPVQVLSVGNEVKVTYSSDVLFGVNGVALADGANVYLDDLVQAVSIYPGATWRVDSFTDKSGSPEKNQQFSEARAEVIALYFVGKGVSSGNITYKGYGSDASIAENDSAAGRTANRRIVVTIVPPVPPSAK